jgi:hypothetical protein
VPGIDEDVGYGTPAYVRDDSSVIVDLPLVDAERPASREPSAAASPGRRNTPLTLVAVLVVLVIVAAVVVVLVLQGQSPPTVPLTPGAGGIALNGTGVAATNTLEPPTLTFTPTNTEPPTVTPPPATPTIPPSPTTVPTLGAGVLPGNTVPTSSGIASPTPLPNAASGDYDVLKALETLPDAKIPWNKDWFGPGGEGWQLGSPMTSAGSAPLVVRLGPDVLTTLFGADSARHLTRLDAELELVSYEKSLLPTGRVFVGIGFESLQGQRATVRAMLVQTNVLDLGMDLNGSFRRKTQLPVTAVKLAVSVQRGSDGTLSLYVDGQLVGRSNAAYAPNTPVSIYMYTSAGGVVVNVRSLLIHLE